MSEHPRHAGSEEDKDRPQGQDAPEPTEPSERETDESVATEEAEAEVEATEDAVAPKPADVPQTGRKGLLARSHLLVALLCAALGFAIVIQVRQTHSDDYATMRQDDLVQLLDEITQRNEELEADQAKLILDRNDLASGVDAQEVAERNAEVQAILAGTVPVRGAGIHVTVREVGDPIPAAAWVNLLEELRNAGAEAIEIEGVRVGASSAFTDTDNGTELDGVLLISPVPVAAIGDPNSLEVALEIPGGALATLRQRDAATEVRRIDDLIIRSVRELDPPEVAQPAPSSTS